MVEPRLRSHGLLVFRLVAASFFAAASTLATCKISRSPPERMRPTLPGLALQKRAYQTHGTNGQFWEVCQKLRLCHQEGALYHIRSRQRFPVPTSSLLRRPPRC